MVLSIIISPASTANKYLLSTWRDGCLLNASFHTADVKGPTNASTGPQSPGLHSFLSVSTPSSLIKILFIGFRAHGVMRIIASHDPSLSYICSVPFPIEVTSTEIGHGHIFLGATIQRTTLDIPSCPAQAPGACKSMTLGYESPAQAHCRPT